MLNIFIHNFIESSRFGFEALHLSIYLGAGSYIRIFEYNLFYFINT